MKKYLDSNIILWLSTAQKNI